MFKVGQKVVFVGAHLTNNPAVNNPEENEIVTIKEPFPEGYQIYEYPTAKNGKIQVINARQLRPIDFNFGEVVAEHVEEQINEEQLISI